LHGKGRLFCLNYYGFQALGYVQGTCTAICLPKPPFIFQNK
jgi:hypothetical protein